MSRSNRSATISKDEIDFWTVFSYFLVLIFMACIPLISNVTGKQRHNQYAEICAADGEKRLLLIKNLPGYIGSDKETKERRKQTNWCDLASQEKVANSARWSTISAWAVTILTLIGIILLFQTLVYTRRTLDEARETAKAANKTIKVTRKIGEAQTRGYLSIIDKFTDISKTDEGANFNVRISWKNMGLSPVVNCEISTHVERVFDYDYGTPIKKFTDIKDNAKLGIRSLMPNEIKIVTVENDIVKFTEWEMNLWKSRGLCIMGYSLAIYEDAFGKSHLVENCNEFIISKDGTNIIYKVYPYHNGIELCRAENT